MRLHEGRTARGSHLLHTALNSTVAAVCEANVV